MGLTGEGSPETPSSSSHYYNRRAPAPGHSFAEDPASARPQGMGPGGRRCSGPCTRAGTDWGTVCSSNRPVGCNAPASTTADTVWGSNRPAGRTTDTRSSATAYGSSRPDIPRAKRGGNIQSPSQGRRAFLEANQRLSPRPPSQGRQPRWRAGSDVSWVSFPFGGCGNDRDLRFTVCSRVWPI
jgi:hypothetical protein